VSGLLGQVGWIARRSIRRSLRQPAVVVPTITFPLLLMAVNTEGLQSVTKLPGFPTDDYINFAVVVCFMQGALFATFAAGLEMSSDIETGFLNRLALTPLRGIAVVIGQLCGAVVIGLLGAVVYLTVGLVFGVRVEAGAGGVAVMLLLVALICLAFASIGSLMALWTGSGVAVQTIFPVMFVLLLLSSANLPRDVIEKDWFRTVATWNPLSYLIEGVRSLVVFGWDGTALWRGFLAAGLIAAAAFTGAAVLMRTRIART
jgi:ABC-2 type transport system permease protein